MGPFDSTTPKGEMLERERRTLGIVHGLLIGSRRTWMLHFDPLLPVEMTFQPVFSRPHRPEKVLEIRWEQRAGLDQCGLEGVESVRHLREITGGGKTGPEECQWCFEPKAAQGARSSESWEGWRFITHEDATTFFSAYETFSGHPSENTTNSPSQPRGTAPGPTAGCMVLHSISHHSSTERRLSSH
jgi:hypothetical protein